MQVIINTEELQLYTLVKFAQDLGLLFDYSTYSFINLKGNRIKFNTMVEVFNNKLLPINSYAASNCKVLLNNLHNKEVFSQPRALVEVKRAFNFSALEKVSIQYNKKKKKLVCQSHIVKIRNRVEAFRIMNLLGMNFNNFKEEDDG